MDTKRLASASICFLLCWCGSIAVGFAFFGDAVIHRDSALFQFVATGAVSAFTVAVITARTSRWALFAFVIGLLFIALSAESTSAARILRDAILVVAVISGVAAGVRLDRLFPRVPIGKFVLWAAVYGVIHAVAVVCIAFLQMNGTGIEVIVPAARIGALVGAGVGVGYETAVVVVGRSGLPDLRMARS